MDDDPAVIPLEEFSGLLDSVNVNVLAFQVHNDDDDSTDLSLLPRIIRRRAPR